ncbi:MAG: hypothetical protein FD119_2613 [Stygiobacter sp.]|nr:MAG: hypothetical protein FD119_2613 [Stygiobacter sp.]
MKQTRRLPHHQPLQLPNLPIPANDNNSPDLPPSNAMALRAAA